MFKQDADTTLVGFDTITLLVLRKFMAEHELTLEEVMERARPSKAERIAKLEEQRNALDSQILALHAEIAQ